MDFVDLMDFMVLMDFMDLISAFRMDLDWIWIMISIHPVPLSMTYSEVITHKLLSNEN